MDLGSPALQPPSWQHPLGTDSLGRDVRSVLLFAGRSSLTIGFCAAAMAFLIGGTMGALAGYFRGAVAAVLLRVTDLFHTLPAIIIVLFSVSLMGSSFWLQVAAVALAIWPIEARIVYGQFITLSEREFVLAARAVGLSTFHIIFREILPNALPTVIVQVSLDASTAILIEAGLGFLGLSDPDRSELGRDAEPRPGIPRAGLVDERLPRHGDLHRRAGLQSVRRRRHRNVQSARVGRGAEARELRVPGR